MFNTAINVIPSVVYWAWDKMSHKEIKQVNPVAVCGLFALIPVLPPRTRFGILNGGKVVVQLEEPMGTIPIVGLEITKQALKRASNRDNRDEIRWFEDAIKLVNKDFGKNRMVQKLLQRTAEGVQVYSNNYKDTDLAYGCLKSLAEILQQTEKEALPYRPIGLAAILELNEKVDQLVQRVKQEEKDPEERESLVNLVKEIAVLVDGSDLTKHAFPIDQDRLESMVRLIEHVYDRAAKKVPCGAELSSALAYLNCIQEDETDLTRQNPNLEVPT